MCYFTSCCLRLEMGHSVSRSDLQVTAKTPFQIRMELSGFAIFLSTYFQSRLHSLIRVAQSPDSNFKGNSPFKRKGWNGVNTLTAHHQTSCYEQGCKEMVLMGFLHQSTYYMLESQLQPTNICSVLCSCICGLFCQSFWGVIKMNVLKPAPWFLFDSLLLSCVVRMLAYSYTVSSGSTTLIKTKSLFYTVQFSA